ncbi:MAG: hypothetical protein ACRD6R_13805 [Candidatus Polarisedimenticolia bacterium]
MRRIGPAARPSLPLGANFVGGDELETAGVHVVVLPRVDVGPAFELERQGVALDGAGAHPRLIPAGAVVGQDEVAPIPVVDRHHFLRRAGEQGLDDRRAAAGQTVGDRHIPRIPNAPPASIQSPASPFSRSNAEDAGAGTAGGFGAVSPAAAGRAAKTAARAAPRQSDTDELRGRFMTVSSD